MRKGLGDSSLDDAVNMDVMMDNMTDVVGTLLIGILLNGMTLLNLTYTAQNVIKALVLLLALILDTLINPRDEQTAQQGDI
jgi:ribose/xylose/arabinose/galactoside ABC-type transport system permease subunit